MYLADIEFAKDVPTQSHAEVATHRHGTSDYSEIGDAGAIRFSKHHWICPVLWAGFPHTIIYTSRDRTQQIDTDDAQNSGEPMPKSQKTEIQDFG